ncbi:iron ABC transporter permease [Candidimonas humi]|uniref:ABC transporter permease n=1 Tax=Candidimonas humi TaxID=683355 RepID=A0ABV8P465_9BURK|nr:iron ABC transporter permease [Candidimonas humi]MBV6306126.1 iron ABC transporter permease [Candidimonas humi]
MAANTPAPRAQGHAVSSRPRGRFSLRVWLPLLFILACLGYPLLLLITSAFNVGDPQALPAVEYGLANFAELGKHLDWIGNTLLVSSLATVLATAIAIILAWILYRTTVPGQRVFEVLISIPYPLGPLVGALAWSALASPGDGILNRIYMSVTGATGPLLNIYTVPGIIFVMAIFEAPVAVLMIGAAMQRMDSSLEESSAIFGAGKLHTALHITLPLLLPAVLSAALFLFTSMMGAFAIPTMLGTNARFYVATTAIYVMFQSYPPNYPLAAAIGVVLIAIAALSVWLYTRAVKSRSFAVVSGKTYRSRRLNMRGWTPVLFGIECLYVLVALVLPIGVLVLASLQNSGDITLIPSHWTLSNFHYVLIDFPTTQQAIGNSLLLGVGTGTIGVALATVIAWTVYRSNSTGRHLLEQVTMLPQAFPRLIFAFGFLWMVLSLPVSLYGTLWAVLLAYIIVFLPLAYRGMSGVIVQIDRSLEEAARVEGAGWSRMMRTVTVPLLKSGIVANWALLFMISVREVSASLFLSGPGTQVLGPAIFSFWDSGGLPKVSALVVVQAAIIMVCLIVVRRITRDKVQS